MTDRGPLERRYRRWLARYPGSFRDRHGEEIVDGHGPIVNSVRRSA